MEERSYNLIEDWKNANKNANIDMFIEQLFSGTLITKYSRYSDVIQEIFIRGIQTTREKKIKQSPLINYASGRAFVATVLYNARRSFPNLPKIHTSMEILVTMQTRQDIVISLLLGDYQSMHWAIFEALEDDYTALKYTAFEQLKWQTFRELFDKNEEKDKSPSSSNVTNWCNSLEEKILDSFKQIINDLFKEYEKELYSQRKSLLHVTEPTQPHNIERSLYEFIGGLSIWTLVDYVQIIKWFGIWIVGIMVFQFSIAIVPDIGNFHTILENIRDIFIQTTTFYGIIIALTIISTTIDQFLIPKLK